MEVDGANELLSKVAAGDLIDRTEWATLRSHILTRLDKIAHDEFPIPKLPPPPQNPRPIDPRVQPRKSSSPAPDSSAEDADKENAPAPAPVVQVQELAPGELPRQIQDMLDDIRAYIQSFENYPPHTIQRLAELIISPRAHYKALAAYLHAVDRVVLVTSGTDVYPLPPAIPDMSSMNINGTTDDESKDPADGVSWGNSTNAAVGSDEALGGALLTPIPWLTRRSPGSDEDGLGAQIHSEGTETIDGPNGVGSIETVSVSINGIVSTGHARGVTQGELLRQEQRAGVVPVSQLARPPAHDDDEEREDEKIHEDGEKASTEEDEEEVPHARGPEEIGVNDTGPQRTTASVVGEGGVEMQSIDVAAAVGRSRDEELHPEPSKPKEGDEEAAEAAVQDAPSPAESTGTKREAEGDLEGEPPRKAREIDDASLDKPETTDKVEEKEASDEAKAPEEAAKKDDA
ncbi:hypothetical protein VHEMI05008 [[Torrubiella] hemipterigena]|uniref:Protein phosphatase 4 core regulatory subunit R2 n=1 Tax=[Torrubiella] hemipterigena TaxID=1531966 RepID=A0A0A1THQ5_9HYPO|nr:hypothetical protein VHEMI05008 [[Torrubiella] hemipterigena]